jgi:DNA repair exonuclease SbcCD ATPase subunit
MEFSILSIVVEDFKSFRGKHRINIDDMRPGTHLVRGFNDHNARLGSNGSGKSTILSDALCWCLFGRTAAGLRNPDVKPWKGKGRPTVNVIVRVGDETKTIMRSAKPSRLLMDGNTIGQLDINNFIGMGFEVFTHTILLAQGRPLFFDKSPRDKMALFSDVLRLDRWDARSKLAAERARTQERSFDRCAGALGVFNEEMKRVRAELPNLKQLVNEWADTREARRQELEKAIEDTKKKIEIKQADVAKYTLMLDGACMQIEMIRLDLATATAEYRDASSAYDQSATIARAAGMQVAYLKNELKKITFGETCPTCKQKIRAGSLTKHRSQLKAAIERARANTEVTDDTPEKLDRATNKRDALERALAEQEDKERRARDMLDLKANPLSLLEQKLSTCFVARSQIEREENPHRHEWVRLRRKLHALKADIAEAQEVSDILERKIIRSKFWVKGFKEMRLYLVEDVLNELTIATNAALEEVGLIGWAVEYTIEKETKAGSAQQGLFVMIKSPDNKKPVRWEAWSGGEGQRLRLIGALALAEVLLAHAGLEPKIEILDEPTRHLSPEGVRDVAEYLILRSQDTGRKIFLVDHQLMDSSQFASTITIAKDRKGSYVVEE